MKKIAVLVDSTAYLANELREKENLKIVYLSTIIGNVSQKEIIEIDFPNYANYLANNSEVLPTTSQPAIGEVVAALEDLSSNGYTDVIAIALSSGISGTYTSYSVASLMVPNIKVHPFDSEVSCQAEEFYVKKALKLIDEGCTPERLLDSLNEMKKLSKAYFIVDDLSHLQRGGRLSGAQALIGNLLQVKPILHFENKLIVPYMKIRTYKKAISKIYDLFEEFYQDNKDSNISVCVIHVEAENKANDIVNYLVEKYPNVNIEKGFIGPVIATHLGLGSVAVGWTIL
ncbi:DegV family protein [Gemelliphila palaticanis]|uniref:DegV family protein n=1 Tax=Gemelliphila palaticanis TaxID=81950 RepID=A0ABX2T0G5_9BACL|nr:DegV family protein [Gemella palaticanis]MBF0716213.1 DegV family protein [Gemella palaticanis]NYS48143.1 DegV family protein [Gemella palaticanis]